MRKRIVKSLAVLCLGAALANADVSEMIFYPETDFSEGIAHFSYQGSVAKDYGFIFDKGVDTDRILYVRPANHIVEKLKDGLVKLSFPDTSSYVYLQKLVQNDFVISREKGIINILLSSGDCMSSPDCVTEENILTVAVPKGYRVKNYRGLDNNLKELHNAQWKFKGNTYTLIAHNVKGASLVMQIEPISAGAAKPVTVIKSAAASIPAGELKSMTYTNDRLFERGSVQLSAPGKKVLESFARLFKQNGHKKVVVEAHTDNTPLQRLKPVYGTNQNLSEARAATVAEYLKVLGVEPSEVIGYGESRPVASNETEDGRLQNGRIELVVLPKEEVSQSSL